MSPQKHDLRIEKLAIDIFDALNIPFGPEIPTCGNGARAKSIIHAALKKNLSYVSSSTLMDCITLKQVSKIQKDEWLSHEQRNRFYEIGSQLRDSKLFFEYVSPMRETHQVCDEYENVVIVLNPEIN